MRAIAAKARGPYPAPMTSGLWRLIALVALLFMPLSMASAPAMAQPAATASAGHCDETQPPADQPVQSEKMHCAACAALPALANPAAADDLPLEAPLVILLSGFLSGIEPEIATPPPRFA